MDAFREMGDSENLSRSVLHPCHATSCPLKWMMWVLSLFLNLPHSKACQRLRVLELLEKSMSIDLESLLRYQPLPNSDLTDPGRSNL